MRLVWDSDAWSDYRWWQTNHPTTVARINALVRDIADNGNTGMGRPESLKDGFHGYWSRRITAEHRLIYKVVGDEIRIASCRYRWR